VSRGWEEEEEEEEEEGQGLSVMNLIGVVFSPAFTPPPPPPPPPPLPPSSFSSSKGIDGAPLDELTNLSQTRFTTQFEFILALAICHTVVIEKGDNGKDIYQVGSGRR